jgi:hypothetical protein
MFAAAAIFLLTGCATAPSENPWATPNRAISLTDEEKAELRAAMQPCVDYARETFPEAVRRFESGLPPEVTLNVMTRVGTPDQQFFVEVDKVGDEQIYGRIASNGVEVNGRRYDFGAVYTVDRKDLVDWLISYRDRPEEGNWLGKYLLLRQDGVVSGPCDPQDSEMQGFRLFRQAYSFVPPSGPGWRLWGREPQLNTDVTLQKQGEGTNEVNTVFVERYRSPVFSTDQELVTRIIEAENKNLGDPDRNTMVNHEVTAYSGKGTHCARSHQVIEDKAALLTTSGERGPMIREILAMLCVQPSQQDVVINLTYSHRYRPGQRDPEFDDKANRVFQSLAFPKFYLRE